MEIAFCVSMEAKLLIVMLCVPLSISGQANGFFVFDLS